MLGCYLMARLLFLLCSLVWLFNRNRTVVHGIPHNCNVTSEVGIDMLCNFKMTLSGCSCSVQYETTVDKYSDVGLIENFTNNEFEQYEYFLYSYYYSFDMITEPASNVIVLSAVLKDLFGDILHHGIQWDALTDKSNQFSLLGHDWKYFESVVLLSVSKNTSKPFSDNIIVEFSLNCESASTDHISVSIANISLKHQHQPPKIDYNSYPPSSNQRLFTPNH